MNKNEVRVFVLHLSQDNELGQLMTQRMVAILKENNAAIVPCKNISKYVISLAFIREQERKDCVEDLKKEGILYEIDDEPAYIDKAYIDSYR